jgi:microcystin-dependent protein
MDNYLGEIRLFAGPRLPSGWQACDGSLLPISEYQALFTLLGTTYGGDGRSTFGVPDLRSRVPIGQGAGPTLTPRTLGAQGGSETVTLQAENMPAHTHPVYASTAAPTQSTLTNAVPAATSDQPVQTGTLVFYAPQVSPAVAAVAFDPKVIGNAGQGGAHDNHMYSTSLNYIIALQGIFPSQS